MDLTDRHLEHFRGRLHDVVDGDTFTLDVDQRLDTTRRLRIRLLGIDTPEARKLGGTEATAFVQHWFATHADPDGWVHVRTAKTKAGKERTTLGRYLAEVWDTADTASLSADLRAAGHIKAQGLLTVAG